MDDIRRLSASHSIKQNLSKLPEDVKRRMTTAAIGQIASVEDFFGELWGHGQKTRTPEQEEWYVKWQACRKSMLDKSNFQLRSVMDRLITVITTFLKR